jgi:hypothetical protein
VTLDGRPQSVEPHVLVVDGRPGARRRPNPLIVIEVIAFGYQRVIQPGYGRLGGVTLGLVWLPARRSY